MSKIAASSECESDVIGKNGKATETKDRIRKKTNASLGKDLSC